jgi:hypothetical protein
MKTAADWEKEIQIKTSEIHQKFPELIKYLDEMPMPISEQEHSEKIVENLANYYASLTDLLKHYAKTH